MFHNRWVSQSPQYKPIYTDATGEGLDVDSGSASARDEIVASRRRSIYFGLLPWMLTVVLTLLCLLLLIDQRHNSFRGPHEAYSSTDFQPITRVPLERVRFHGSPQIENNGSVSLGDFANAAWPENMKYSGKPSPEIDANWQRLIGNRYFSVSEEEAQAAWGERRHEYVDETRGGYTAAFDVFHTLHCLNELRKSQYPDYYYKELSAHAHADEVISVHNDHCIEYLRQMVQCYGDTTLIPTRYAQGIRHNYADSNQVHVCRSFPYLRDYTDLRAKGQEKYIPRDQSLLDDTKHEHAMKWFKKDGKSEQGIAT